MSVLEYGLSITPHLRRSSSTWHQHPQCLTWLLSRSWRAATPAAAVFYVAPVRVVAAPNARQAGPVAECVASVPKGLAPVAVVMMLAPVLYAVPMPEVE